MAEPSDLMSTTSFSSARKKKLAQGWKSFITSQPLQDQTTETSDYNWLLGQIHGWKPRVITGTFEAGGCAASGHQHSLYDDWTPGVFLPRTSHPVRAATHGKDAHQASCEYSDRAAKEITTFSPPVYKIIRPRRDDKTHRIASSETAWLSAIRDHSEQKYVNYDRMGRQQEANTMVNYQKGHSGSQGTVERIDEYSYEEVGDDLGETSGGGLTARPDFFEHPEAVVDVAWAMAETPPECLQKFYKDYPQEGLLVKAVIDEIAEMGQNEIGETEARLITNIIRHASELSDVYRIIDPMMNEFTVHGEERKVNPLVKKNYNRLLKIFSGQFEDEVPGDYAIYLYPLAVHMYEHDLPVDITNTLSELQLLVDVREELQFLATTHRQVLERGGPMELLAFANKDALNVINQVDGKTLQLLFRETVGKESHALEYPEMAGDLPSSTSRKTTPNQTSLVPGVSSSGFQRHVDLKNTNSAHGVLKPSEYSRTHVDGKEQLHYSTYQERAPLSTLSKRSWYGH
jgi:hypothetical protein